MAGTNERHAMHGSATPRAVSRLATCEPDKSRRDLAAHVVIEGELDLADRPAVPSSSSREGP